MSVNASRNATLAKIHIAKKDLALDDEIYREILWTVARVRSAKDLDAHGRDAVLAHFKSRGWQPKAAKRAGRVPRTLNRKEELAKIEAQLTSLGAPWEYADTIAAKVAKVDRCEWLKTHEQFSAVIAALEAEQTKRDLLADIDRCLTALGETHADVDALIRPARRGRWQRYKPLLAKLAPYLRDRCAQAGIDPHAPEPPAA